MMVRRLGLGLVVASLLGGTALAPPAAVAGPEAQAGLKRCGEIRSPTGKLLALEARGVRCRKARKVIRTYYRKVRAGECAGSACHIRSRGFACATLTAAKEQATGLSTTCERGRDLVRTVVAPPDA